MPPNAFAQHPDAEDGSGSSHSAGAALPASDLDRSAAKGALMGERGGFRWWHAVAIFIAANAASALPSGFGGDFAFYNSFRQPFVAPPHWAFAPVWMFLNVTSLIALHRVANAPERFSGRTVFMWSEGVAWVLFAAFTTLYFLLRSPVLGAVDTAAGMAVGVVSLVCVARRDGSQPYSSCCGFSGSCWPPTCRPMSLCTTPTHFSARGRSQIRSSRSRPGR